MMGIGVFSLLGKLHKWDESAMWFDGSSLGTVPYQTFSLHLAVDGFLSAAFVFAISVYLTVIIPNLKNVVTPGVVESEFTPDQSLSLIGAGNSIVMVLLILILALQVRLDRRSSNELHTEQFLGWPGIRQKN
jgi:ER membrane protein SH3